MMEFNFTYQTASDGSSELTLQQMTAFEVAGRIWSAYLQDDVTVNVHVSISNDLPENVIGGALPGVKAGYKFHKLKDDLERDRTSPDDQTVYIHEGYGDSNDFDATANGIKLHETDEVNLTRAQAKALDINIGNTKQLDGVIFMSDLSNLNRNQDANTQNDITWDFGSPNQSPTAGDTVDFLSVAVHELGHILGFVSGIDKFEWQQSIIAINSLGQDGHLELREFGEDDVDDFDYKGNQNRPQVIDANEYDEFGEDAPATVLDLFRYAPESSDWGADLSVGGTKYFSIDGGKTALAEFATGKEESLSGDGYQASHWKDSRNPLGIMNPTLRLNQANTISMLDLRAFDVIGWDLANSLLGEDGTTSQAELQNTLDLNHSQSLANLWHDAESHVRRNQSSLVGDRLDDVLDMIEESDIYERRRRKRGGVKSSWQELWQEITDVFSQEGSFSTVGLEDAFQVSGVSAEPLTPLETPVTARIVSPEFPVVQDAVEAVTDVFPPASASAMTEITSTLLKGTKTNDTLLGSDTHDRINGHRGKDRIKGKAGDDLLKGGNHRDVLRGGAGADIFVVQDKKAFDVVRDFTANEDMLKLGSQLTFEQLTIGQRGDHTIISRDDDRLMVLRNVEADVMTATDFV